MGHYYRGFADGLASAEEGAGARRAKSIGGRFGSHPPTRAREKDRVSPFLPPSRDRVQILTPERRSSMPHSSGEGVHEMTHVSPVIQ